MAINVICNLGEKAVVNYERFHKRLTREPFFFVLSLKKLHNNKRHMPNKTNAENPGGSLVFESAEKAEKFVENVKKNFERRKESAAERETGREDSETLAKKAIKEELLNEQAGLTGGQISEGKGEWQYTEEDRDQVQKYVNVAFATDIQKAVEALMREKIVTAAGGKDEGTALRTLDLFHDTLTDFLYEEMGERGILPRS